MSNSNLASQAAALAAIKAINNSKEEDVSQYAVRLPLKLKNNRTTSASSIPRSSNNLGSEISKSISTSQIGNLQVSKAVGSSANITSRGGTTPTTHKETAILKSPKLVERPGSIRILNKRPVSGVIYLVSASDTDSVLSYATDQPSLLRTSQDKFKKTTLRSISQTNPQEMIKNVKNSVESKFAVHNQSLKRLSQSYEPQEMIKNIRQSINSKTISVSQKNELSSKHQALINGIRDSIDSKKGSSSFANSNSKLSLSEGKSSANNVSNSNARLTYDQYLLNSSYSSLDSTLSNEEIPRNTSTPAIFNNNDVLGPHGSNNQSKEIEDSNTNGSSFGNENNDETPSGENDTSGKNRQSALNNENNEELTHPGRNLTSVSVPQSSNPLSRTLNIGSNESVSQTPSPRLSNTRYQSFDSTKTTSDESYKFKLKRKPPPSMDSNISLGDITNSSTYIDQSELEHEDGGSDFSLIAKGRDAITQPKNFVTTNDLISSKLSLGNNKEDYYYYFTDGEVDASGLEKPINKISGNEKSKAVTKFPQFPDINETSKSHKKHPEHKHGIFKKKYKIKGVNNSVNLLDSSEDSDIDLKTEVDSFTKTSSKSSTPILSHQPVQLKATMRKTNRRKDKKLLFNENKPWKNHNELNYITEQERKRYEGVWVSNMGHYINSVVTKLIGINYDRKSDNETYIEEEVSRKAARLCSEANNFDSSSQIDQQNFHNLVSAEVNQLIHGVVVKRIWKRSRLPNETLKAIWDLVDFRKDGSLNKPEFIVGMWLVDQSLYGRKLPKKVDDVVWDSLGSIGLNVVIKKKGRR